MIKSNASATLSVVRSGLLLLFLLGVMGTSIELLLIGHTEEFWQWIPLGLMGASLLVLGWHSFSSGFAALRVFRLLMVLFAVGAVAGIYLHYHGNVEFEREMSPQIGGFNLFTEAVTGATPALAPGVMLQLSLIGLLYTLRHPRFRPEPTDSSTV